MSNGNVWERAWSTDEIIANSDNWSLAGDAALLHTLEDFSKNMIEKATQINNQINNLSNNLNEARLQLDIAQNKFQSLRNTQFIESRVYEDDETLQDTPNIPPDQTEQKDQNYNEEISTAVTKSLKLLDKYYDKVEVSVSDSEDETDFPNYILTPKDLYFDRPLPYIIGTDEWHQKWHVGLEDSSSDGSESDPVSENVSDTDSETDLQFTFDRSQNKNISDETSLELDFSKNDPIKPSESQEDLFVPNEEQPTSLPVNPTGIVDNFAQQLAEKLGHALEGNTKVNTKPIQKITTHNYDKIFFDEPPPLIDNKPFKKGSSSGLFDDSDNESENDIWNDKTVSSKIQSQKGLFNDDDDDIASSDDDIFNTSNKSTKPQHVGFPSSKATKLPLFIEEPPPVNEEEHQKSATGKSSNLLEHTSKIIIEKPEKEKPKKSNLFEDDDDDEDIVDFKKINNSDAKKTNLFGENQTNPPEDLVVEKNIFSDDINLFKDDLFSNTSTNKFTSSLFDDNNDDDDASFLGVIPQNVSLFDNSTKKLTESNQSDNKEDLAVPLSSTHDDTPEPREVRLFDSGKVKEQENISDNTTMESTKKLFESAKKTVNLFDSRPPSDDEDWETTPDPYVDLFDPDSPLVKKLDLGYPTLHLSDSEDNILHPKTNRSEETKKDDLKLPSIKNEEFPTLLENKDSQSDVVVESANEKGNNNVQNLKNKFLGPASNPESIIEKKLPIPINKLNSNKILNINVKALLPNALPKKPQGSVDNLVDKSIETVNDDKIDTVFNITDTKVEVLTSVTKDRARLPLNRKPSTRRGRKAALETSNKQSQLEPKSSRPSTNESQCELVKDSPPVTSSLSKSDTKTKLFDTNEIDKLFDSPKEPSPILSTVLAPSDPYDDFLRIKDVVVVENKSSTGTKKLFEESVESKPKQSNKIKDLFDDNENDSDIDLFIPKKSNIKQRKSLFDDDQSDDDEIFQSNVVIKRPENKAVKRDNNKINNLKGGKTASGIRKLDQSKPEDDPLGILK